MKNPSVSKLYKWNHYLQGERISLNLVLNCFSLCMREFKKLSKEGKVLSDQFYKFLFFYKFKLQYLISLFCYINFLFILFNKLLF